MDATVFVEHIPLTYTHVAYAEMAALGGGQKN